MLRAKRIIVTFCALASFLIVFGFRHQIFMSGVEWFLNHNYIVDGGWKFRYEDVLFERGSLSFSNATISANKSSIDIEVEQLCIIWKKSRFFNLDVCFIFNDPLIKLYKSECDNKTTPDKIINSSLSKYNIDINKAKLQLNNGSVVTNVYFSMRSDPNVKSMKTFYLSDIDDLNSKIMVKLYMWPNELISECEMQDVDIVWASKITSFFKKELMKCRNIKSGMLSGHLWVGIDSDGRLKETTSILSVNNFISTDDGNGLEFKAEELKLDFSYPSRKKVEMREMDSWWKKSTLKGDVVGGEIGFKDVKSKIDFSICDISGSVNFNSFKDSDIYLKGYVDHKGQISPVILSGNPSLKEKCSLDFDLKLLFASESDTFTNLNLSIANCNDNMSIVRGTLSDLGVEQIALFQHIIGFGIPSLRDFKVNSGSVTCELSLYMLDGKIDKILLDNFIANNLQIYCSNRNTLGFASHLNGNARLDFDQNNGQLKFPSWQVNMKSGEFVVGCNDKCTMKFSDVDMELFVCRDVFKPSCVKVNYEGIDVKIDLSGYYAEAEMKIEANTSVDKLISLFNSRLNLDYNKDRLIKMNIDINRRFGYWDVLCDVKLDVKGQIKDKIDVGFHLSDNILKCDFSDLSFLIKKNVSNGIFSGSDISCEFVNLVNSCFKNRCSLEGQFSINGFFDGEGIDFELKSSDLCFFSPFANVIIDKDKCIDSECKVKLNLSNMFEKTDCEAHVNLINGALEINSSIYIKELSFDFDLFNHNNEASITNVSGKLSSSFYENDYILNGRYVNFHFDEINPLLTFDVRVENDIMDLIRLVGQLNINSKNFYFNKELTHFLGLKFENVAILLNQDLSLSKVDAKFVFPCNEIISYCKFFNDFGLFSVAPFELLSSYTKCDGLLFGEISYSNEKLELSLNGMDCFFNKKRCSNFDFHCIKNESIWKIDRLNINNFFINGDFVFSNNGDIFIKQLFVNSNYGDAVFKNGTFDINNKTIHLPISYMNINMSPFVNIVGTLNVVGDIDVSLTTSFDISGCANIELQSSEMLLDGFSIYSKSILHIDYDQNHNFIMKNGVAALMKDNIECLFEISNLVYEVHKQVLRGNKIKCTLMSSYIDRLLSKLPLDSKFLSKRANEDSSFLFDFELVDGEFKTSAIFDDGNYIFEEKEFSINKMSFKYDQKKIDVSLQIPFMQKNFYVNCTVCMRDFFYSHIEIFDLVDPKKNTLVIDCKFSSDGCLIVDKVEGSLFGLEFNFFPIADVHNDNYVKFIGNIKIDADLLTSILTDDLKSLVHDLKLHRGYDIHGEFVVVKNRLFDSTFSGYLKGRDFDFFGYQLKTMLSSININKNGIILNDFHISDNGVAVKVDEIRIQRNSNLNWYVQIPKIIITDLRPSLLKRERRICKRLKPFYIKEMVFVDIFGDLSDAMTFTGKGHFNFINTFKKEYHPLNIPIEIISSLGLDMVLLIPIQGEMDYYIKNGKLIFTKLKNSFSESKRSHFYLWNKNESYIDFDGNMHIDIKMKQYVLFKITELFILSINGTVDHPKFSLR